MSIESINKQIEALEKQKKELERKLEEAKSLTPAQQLAEILHSKICHWNHTDGCGWHYESWINPGYSRKEYLEKAKGILEEVDFNAAIKVIKCI
jgi:hypothetical protein